MVLTGVEMTMVLIAALLGAVFSVGAGIWILRFGDSQRPDRMAALAVCGLTSLWCVLAATFPSGSPIVELAAMARNFALIAVIYRLFSADGRDESLKPTRPVLLALVMVQSLQPALLGIREQVGGYPELVQLTGEVSAVLNMLVAIGALVLLHNLYAGAAAASRQIIRWSGIALAVMFGYELNLYTIAYLSGSYPEVLIALESAIGGAMTVFLALGMHGTGSRLQFRPSRAVTFQTLSLLVIGSYLLVMVLITRSLTLLGEDIGRLTQIGFLVVAVVVAIIWLPSPRLRGWLRVTATKHLFQHRYDYRQEWLRFMRTIGHASGAGPSFYERAAKALADITDSPAALLLMPNEEAKLELTARWNWPTVEVPAVAGDFSLSAVLEQHNHILDMDEARAGVDYHGELAHLPAWLNEAQDAWALVPLLHFDRLVGVIVLARPRIERRLDWEDFDLLRVVGQQLASYIAEQASQQALMDASRFDEFNRRMAFVMHDIKNLASQLSLLSANAQKHSDNPAFRADMLVTLSNSSDKLNALLARLGRYGSGGAANIAEIDLAKIASGVCKRFEHTHPVSLCRADKVRVRADTEALEQAVIHLVQNAVDASTHHEPVFLSVSSDGINGQIEVVDTGSGMTPEFVRTGLFKPFVSSKQDGFGIGAFEAREMIKAMGGRLTVTSREGVGTRFCISLPVPEAAQLIKNQSQTESKEVA